MRGAEIDARLTSWRTQVNRPELRDAGSRREGHGPGEVRRRLPRRRHAVLQAAAQPDAARPREAASTRARRSRCRASKAILTAEELAGARATSSPISASAFPPTPKGERALTNEPVYQGEPMLAVAAVDELTAADAIEQIEIEWEPLPFVVDPLDEPAARRAERAARRQRLGPAEAGRARRSRRTPPAIEELKWTDADFADYDAGPAADGQDARRVDVRRRRGRIQERGARPRRDLRRRRTPATRRSSRARRWPTGRTASCTSTARRRAPCRRSASVSRWLHMDPKDVVLISAVHRRRIRQQGDRHDHVDDPGAAVEES